MATKIELSNTLRGAPFTQFLRGVEFAVQDFDVVIVTQQKTPLARIIIRDAYHLTRGADDLLRLLRKEPAFVIVQFSEHDIVLLDEISLLLCKFATILPSRTPQQTAYLICALQRYSTQSDAIFTQNYSMDPGKQAWMGLKTLIRENYARKFIGCTLRDVFSMSEDEIARTPGFSIAGAREFVASLEESAGKKMK